MDLDRYIRYLRRYWSLPAILLGAGILGAWVYVQWNKDAIAESTVAVLEPVVTHALDGKHAQVNFASVAESRTVAERVVQVYEIDMDPEALQGKISVKLSRTLVPSVITPLYIVRVKNPDPQWAIFLADKVVEQASKVFVELNVLNPSFIDDALLPEEERIRLEAEQARNELHAFEEANRAWMLDSQIDAQLLLLNSLRQPARLTQVAEAGRAELEKRLLEEEAELDRLTSLMPEYESLAFDARLAAISVQQLSDVNTVISIRGSSTVARNQLETARAEWERAQEALLDFQESNADLLTMGIPDTTLTLSTEEEDSPVIFFDFPAELATQRAVVTDLRLQLIAMQAPVAGFEDAVGVEETELRRMLSLLPEYERLRSRSTQAEGWLSMLNARKVDMVIDGSLAPAAQVKVLDPAHLDPDTLGTYIIYGLSIVLGASIALLAVYLIAYFDRTPQTAAEVQELIGAPVLVHVPSGFAREVPRGFGRRLPGFLRRGKKP